MASSLSYSKTGAVEVISMIGRSLSYCCGVYTITKTYMVWKRSKEKKIVSFG